MKQIKDCQLMIRVTKEERDKFKEVCSLNDENMQRVLRNFIKEYIKTNKED